MEVPPGEGSGAKSEDGDASMSSEVEALKEFCMQMQKELMTHREVLEQWVEVRETVLEIAQHRETFAQCLELRDGIQVVVNSSRVISDMDSRTSELDLSLAGVSDNTARHGKALSTLTDQQRRTDATLDAVVRAVKRLDRSRSKGRHSVGSHPGSDYGYAGGYGMPETGAFPPSGFPSNGMAADCGAQLEGEYDMAAYDDVGYGATNEGAWLDKPAQDGQDGGIDEPRIISGSSSCGSDARQWRQPEVGVRGADGKTSSRSGRGSSGAPGAKPDMANCVKGVLARIEEALTKLDDDGQPTKADQCASSCSGSDPGLRAASASGQRRRAGDGGGRAPNGHGAPDDLWPRGSPTGGASGRSGRTPAGTHGSSSGRPGTSRGGSTAADGRTPRRDRQRNAAQTARPTDVWRAADSWG